MNELGLDVNQALSWFAHEVDAPYILVRVSSEHANGWATALRDAVRRCYLTDELLQARAWQLENELHGNHASRQAQIINSKLPDPGSTMAGDFGEILIYIYQAAKAHPQVAFGPKKWRLKQDRTKPAPCSDVVHFILPTWPTPSGQDEVLCAEVKMKATNGASTPIEDAIRGCAKDRVSRLAKTLQWFKERATIESIGEVKISHLDRFIKATDYPPAIKRFRAVAVISSDLLDAELPAAPKQASPEYTLVVVAIPDLRTVYSDVYNAVRAATLPE